MKTKFQKGQIALNGIQSYLQWKFEVIKEYLYTGYENGYVHPDAEFYISETFGSFEPLVWDETEKA